MLRFSSLFLACILWQVACTLPEKPVPVVIFDTDMGPDYDDAGAITLLHALADSGQVRILATIASDRHANVAAVLNVFNTYFGRPGIPIAIPDADADAVADADVQHWTDTLVARYPHAVRTNAQAPAATGTYRRLLAAQPDTSVTVVTVGFLTNLAHLLASGPDAHSPLGGTELVRRKVKRLVSMAGTFPQGREFNVYRDAASARRVFDRWPTPILFSGFEIGEKIKTGLPLVTDAGIRNNPVKDAYRISMAQDSQDRQGRMSWDQTAVLVAVKGHRPYYTARPGRILMAEDGSNTWDAAGSGHHYLVAEMPVEKVTQVIDRLMKHQPTARKKGF